MAALYLNMVLPEMDAPFGHVAASDVTVTLGGVLQEWGIFIGEIGDNDNGHHLFADRCAAYDG